MGEYNEKNRDIPSGLHFTHGCLNREYKSMQISFLIQSKETANTASNEGINLIC